MSRNLQWAMVAAGLVGAVAMVGVGLRPVPFAKAAGKGELGAQDRLVVTPLPASIELRGLADRMGDATAGTYSLRIGSQQLAPQPTSLPAFAITLPRINNGDMVSLVLEAPGVKFTSILGTYAQLVSLAGADRVLTVEESDALRVSPFSTGLEFLVRQRLGGMPLTDAQHEAVWRGLVDSSFTPDVTLPVAAELLARTASGELPEPAGFDNGYAVLESRETAAQFAGSLSGNDILMQLAYTPLRDSDLSRAQAILGARRDASAATFVGPAQILERDGDAWRLHGPSTQNPSYSGVLDAAGRFALEPVAPFVQETISGTCASGQPRVVRETEQGREYRLHRRGATLSLWVENITFQTTFPTCPELEPSSYSMAFLRSVLALRPVALTPRRDPGVAGLRALPYLCAASREQPSGPVTEIRECEYTPHLFQSGGAGVISELGSDVNGAMDPIAAQGSTAFTWRAGGDSQFSVSYDNLRVRYWKVEGNSAPAEATVYVAEMPSQEGVVTVAGHTVMINGNVAAGFSELSVPGTWVIGSSLTGYDPWFEPGLRRETRMVYRAEGKLDEYTWMPYWEGVPSQPRPRTWDVYEARLYSTTVGLDGQSGTVYYTCADAAAAGRPNCAKRRVAVFRPVARVGDRLYGIEDIYTNRDASTDPTPWRMTRTSRPTYYERRSTSTTPPTNGLDTNRLR